MTLTGWVFIAAPDGDIGCTEPDPELFGFHVERTMTDEAELELARSSSATSDRAEPVLSRPDRAALGQ